MHADDTSLDNPAYAALTGPHTRFVERHGAALRYAPDVCPMAALPNDPADGDWADAAALAGAGSSVFIPVVDVTPPSTWGVAMSMSGVQMIDAGIGAVPDEEAVTLTTDDVPEMLDLVRRTDPGPFRPRTIELGTYLGIRRDGALIAMAGERLHVPGWTEISAVCTDPGHRGQGLAARLIRAVAHGIGSRGETAFLHAAASNINAIRLYETMGFAHRTLVKFQVFTAPE